MQNTSRRAAVARLRRRSLTKRGRALNISCICCISRGPTCARTCDPHGSIGAIMKLPHTDRLQIPKAKVVHYLLSSTHRAGRGKARFFSAFGFQASAWAELANALQQQARESDVVLSEDTPFGTRYVIEGFLVAPNGRQLQVRTVWFIDAGGQTPRFVTAYPLKRRMP